MAQKKSLIYFSLCNYSSIQMNFKQDGHLDHEEQGTQMSTISEADCKVIIFYHNLILCLMGQFNTGSSTKTIMVKELLESYGPGSFRKG